MISWLSVAEGKTRRVQALRGQDRPLISVHVAAGTGRAAPARRFGPSAARAQTLCHSLVTRRARRLGKALIGLRFASRGAHLINRKSAPEPSAPVDQLATMCPHILGFGGASPTRCCLSLGVLPVAKKQSWVG